MEDLLTQDAVKKAFPHGMTVAREGDYPNLDLVHPEVVEQDGKPMLLAWALPNKDLMYSPEDIEEKDGSWYFHQDGLRYRMTPLSPERGKALAAQMAEF